MLSSFRFSIALLIALFVISSCQTDKLVDDSKVKPDKPPVAQKSENPIAELVSGSEVFNSNFTGFMLYNPQEDSILYQQNGDKYFTPASNTKLYTFYASLKMLPDRLPALEYSIQNDSLIIWGTGYPAFLHPEFEDSTAFEFLKNSSLNIYYSDHQFEDEVLGPGWAWSDYQNSYSAERTPFPMYGNVIEMEVEEINQVRIRPKNGGLDIHPALFNQHIEPAEQRKAKEIPFLYRGFADNTFKYNPASDTTTYTITRPYHYTPALITELLSDTLKRTVEYVDRPKSQATEKLYGIHKDTVLTRMLQPSDNFLAEQLLFNIAAENNLPMNSRTVIQEVSSQFFSEFEKEPVWRDGSGLSRYNLFTPGNMVELLKLIDAEFEDDGTMLRHFPAGGKSGTIRSWYAHRDEGMPYVFAKTGTLNNNHCLSGFIITEKGTKLMFSFMNNHYVSSSSVVKTEMEKVLWEIYKTY